MHMLKYSIHCRKRIEVLHEWVQLYYVITENGNAFSHEKKKTKIVNFAQYDKENNKSIM